MTRKILTAALISLALTFPSVAPAAKTLSTKVGNGIDFTYGIKDGIYFVVENRSSSLVTSVVVRQVGTSVCVPQKQRSKANMAGSRGTENFFEVWGNANCTYRIAFKTTKGCIGHKVGKMTQYKYHGDIRIVRLTGACGTLAVKFEEGSLIDRGSLD